MLRSICAFALIAVVFSGYLVDFSASNKYTCENATASTTFNSSNFNGTWYLIACSPQPKPAEYCVAYTAKNNGSALNFYKNYSTNTNQLWQMTKQTLNFSIPVNSSKAEWNVTLSGSSSNHSQITVKVLDAVEHSYALLCGYNSTSEYGWVLASDRAVQSSLWSKWNPIITNHTAFAANSNITQTGCTKNGAASNVPMLSAALALLYYAVLRHLQ